LDNIVYSFFYITCANKYTNRTSKDLFKRMHFSDYQHIQKATELPIRLQMSWLVGY